MNGVPFIEIEGNGIIPVAGHPVRLELPDREALVSDPQRGGIDRALRFGIDERFHFEFRILADRLLHLERRNEIRSIHLATDKRDQNSEQNRNNRQIQ